VKIQRDVAVNKSLDNQNVSEKVNRNNRKRVYAPASKRVHLKSYENVRMLISTVVNDLRQQKIAPDIARAVIYGCSVLLQVFEGKLLEQDIRELQEIARARFGYGG
jgi:hypothetical protein